MFEKNVFTYMKKDEVCKAFLAYVLNNSEAKYEIVSRLIKSPYHGSIEVYTDYALLYTQLNSVDMLIKLEDRFILVALNEKHFDYFPIWSDKLKEDVLYTSKAKITKAYVTVFDIFEKININKLTREDLKDILNSYCHDITIKEFIRFLNDIDNQMEAYESIDVKDFTFLTTVGLYKSLSKKTILKDINIVASREGDYLRIKENPKTYNEIIEGFLYFEISNNKLLLKLQLNDNYNVSDVRDSYSKLFLEGCANSKLDQWIKPIRMGYGQVMTLALVEPSTLLNNNVNISSIASLVKKSKKVLNSIL